jgi:hypothetical protein
VRGRKQKKKMKKKKEIRRKKRKRRRMWRRKMWKKKKDYFWCAKWPPQICVSRKCVATLLTSSVELVQRPKTNVGIAGKYLTNIYLEDQNEKGKVFPHFPRKFPKHPPTRVHSLLQLSLFSISLWSSYKNYGVVSIAFLLYMSMKTNPSDFCQFLFKEPQIPYSSWENKYFPWKIPHPEEFGVLLIYIYMFVVSAHLSIGLPTSACYPLSRLNQ